MKEMKTKTKIKKISKISILEADILLVMWERDKATIREVYEVILKKEIKIKELGFTPYSTFLSTMNLLVKKKILRVNTDKKTFFYTALMDRKELTKTIIWTVADKLLP